MKRITLIIGVFLSLSGLAHGRAKLQGPCGRGNTTVTVSGLSGTPKVQGSYAPCQVTVYLTGTVTLASLYSNDSGTVKANPFCSDSTGWYSLYADDGRYDLSYSQGSCGGPSFTPYSLGDWPLADPARPSQVRDACQSIYGYPASDFGTVVTNAQADLPGNGGTVDARCYQGDITNNTAITVGATDKPVLLIIGAARIITTALIRINAASAITGIPSSHSDCNTTNVPSIIRAADGSNLSNIVELYGDSSALRFMGIDGNKTNNPTGGNGLLVQNGNFTMTYGVSVLQAKGDGIHVESTSAAGSHINSSVVCNSDGNGIRVYGAGDIFIDDTQSENNEKRGYDLECANDIRIIGGDSGGNGHNSGGAVLSGVKFYCNSGFGFSGNSGFISDMQVGANYGHQVEIDGWDTTLGSQNTIFINLNNLKITKPSAFTTTNTVNGIDVTDGYGNRITGTVFSSDPSHTLKYGIQYHNVHATSLNDVVGVTFTGTFGTNSISGVAGSPFLNCSMDPNYFLGYCRYSGNMLLNNQNYVFELDSTATAQAIIGMNPDDSVSIMGTNSAGAGAGKHLHLQASPSHRNITLLETATLFNNGHSLFVDENAAINYNSQELVLSAGANNNVTLDASSYFIVTAPGDFSITGFVDPSAQGHRVLFYNGSGHVMTLANVSGSSSFGNQISTGTGATITITQMVDLIYSGTVWFVISAR